MLRRLSDIDVPPAARVVYGVASIVLAAAIALAGCGGDDGETTTATPLSNEEFVAEVTAICAEAGAALAAQGDSIEANIESEDSFASFYAASYQPILDSLLDDLGAIGPPAAKGEDYGALLDAFEESNALSREDPLVVIAAAIDPDSTTAERYAALDHEIDELAAPLGIPQDCGDADERAEAPSP